MTRRLTLLAALLCAAPGLGAANLAEVVCDDSKRLERQLTTVVGAERQGRGMRGPEALLEMWIEPGSGDWTLVQSYPNGTSCIVAMGEHWETLTAPPDPA